MYCKFTKFFAIEALILRKIVVTLPIHRHVALYHNLCACSIFFFKLYNFVKRHG